MYEPFIEMWNYLFPKLFNSILYQSFYYFQEISFSIVFSYTIADELLREISPSCHH